MACHLLDVVRKVVWDRTLRGDKRLTTSMNTMRNRLLDCFVWLLLVVAPGTTRAADTFLGFNEFWFYQDNGVDQGTNWRQETFDFYLFNWQLGITEMGFGEGDEFTPINPSINTAYFATSFNVNNAADYSNVTVRLVRDDGAIVYINGVEVFRSNMPTGSVNYLTKALRNLEGDDEFMLAQRVVPASVLINGANTLAVEVHQAEGGGGDMSFAANLIGHLVGENQPPSANSSFVSTEQDKSTNITLNATDPDNNPLTFTVLSGPEHGSVSGTGPVVTYTPAAGYVGPDMFSFMASDGEWNTEVAYVCIDVKVSSNHPPTADAQNVSVAEDNSLSIALTASDPDGDTLSYSFTAAGHGTLTPGLNNSVVYQPALNYFGPDSFDFTVDDGHGATATATIQITVTPVNDAPVTDAQSLATDEDTSLAIVLTASDVEGDALSFSFAQPAHGVVTGTGNHLTYQPAANYNGPDAFNFTVSDGNGGTAVATIHIVVNAVNDNPVANAQTLATAEDTALSITLTGSDVDGDPLAFAYAQPAHGTVTGAGDNVVYTPTPNYNGPDAFTFAVSDGNGGIATATVSITVTPVNDNPTAQAQNVSVNEDSSVAIVLSASDVDGDALAYSYSLPAHGTLTGTGNNVTYQPSANYNGSDSFAFTVDDGHGGSSTAVISITVVPVNDAPVAVAKEAPAAHPTSFTRSLVLIAPDNQNALVVLNGSDSSDVDGDVLAFGWYDGANATPFSTSANTTASISVGSHALTLVVSDGAATASDTITVQVITPCDAVQAIVADVQAANIKAADRKALLDRLNKACSEFNAGHMSNGVRELKEFQKRVNSKIAPSNPALAQSLNAKAQAIIDAVNGQ